MGTWAIPWEDEAACAAFEQRMAAPWIATVTLDGDAVEFSIAGGATPHEALLERARKLVGKWDRFSARTSTTVSRLI